MGYGAGPAALAGRAPAGAAGDDRRHADRHRLDGRAHDDRGVVGYGGLGNLICDGLSTDFKAQVLTASVLCVVLGVVVDLLLLGVQWL